VQKPTESVAEENEGKQNSQSPAPGKKVKGKKKSDSIAKEKDDLIKPAKKPKIKG
jgi:hypothetical protein